MINVSNEFKEVMKERRNFRSYAVVQFANGTTLQLDYTQFTSGNNSIVDGAGGSSFPLGVAVQKALQIEILNDNEQYKDYIFSGAKIRFYLDFQLSETTERIEKGTYTVVSPETYGETIIITAYDDMYKADRDYETNLVFPQSAGAVLRDICSTCDIVLGSTTFPNDNFVIQTKPEGKMRQIIGYIAMIAGGNARIDTRNRLQIIRYSIPPTNNATGYQVLSEWKSPKIEYNDSYITGFKTILSDSDTELLVGTDDYVITIENPLITGQEEAVLTFLLNNLGNVPFRPFSGDLVSDPTIEFMDGVLVQDRRGNKHRSFITDVNFLIPGFTAVKNASPGIGRKASYSSTTSKVEIATKKLIEKERTDRELAIEALNQTLSESSGMYTTQETQPDGSTITYLHDKPTIAESQNVIKITAEAIGISNDGGETYPYGLQLTGELIANLLYVVGINADYINTGAITVKDSDGNILFQVDMDTKQVIISGDSVRIGSKSVSAAISDAVSESKDYSDGKLADYANTVSDDLAILQAQVDGQVEDWYYDYEPSMQNYPASEWTTTEERTKHIGDRFFWKSKGYAYRFMQDDNGAWGWVLLQDTDITKAMQTATKAQDTADGKRRTFVVTPQPPYDIGDLWINGDDILTCVVSRASGSTYVSSDWQKLNKYTDDTVANQALSEIEAINNQITLKVWKTDIDDALDNLEIGGRNLLLQSATKKPIAYMGAQITFETDVSVPEWGAVDAVRAYGTGGTGRVFCYIYGSSTPSSGSLNGVNYVHSIYIKNNGQKDLTVSNNSLGASQTVQPGTATRVVLTGVGNGNNNLQLDFSMPTAGDEFDFVYWHPKIEEGNTVTDWTPAPEDTDTAIDEVKQTITDTKAEIKLTTDSISQSVSSIQTTVSNHTTQINNKADSSAVNALTTRVTAAEQKLTKDSLVTTIGSYYATQTALNATNSNVTAAQTTANSAYSLADAKGIDYSQGKMLQTDPMFASGTNSCSVYNNSSNGTVTVTRTAKSSDNPMTGTSYELTVRTAGTASPGLGGYVQSVDSRANAVFIRRIIAKIPTGYKIQNAQNSMGTGYTVTWLTPRDGTGKFAEYVYKYVCGPSGTFSNGGHVYLEGTAATSSSPVTWYVAYSTTFDMTNISDVIVAQSVATQTQEMIRWVVKSGTSASDFTLTDRTATLIAESININGLVAFTGLNSDAQSRINSAQTLANSALSTANTAKATANSALSYIDVKDTRNDNQNPQWYMQVYPQKIVREFKSCSAIGLSVSSTFCTLETKVPWKDSTGGYPTQVATVGDDNKVYKRVGTSNTAWGSWQSADQILADWCYNNNTTYIDGGKIYTGTVTASKINVTSLSAISADLGSITAGSINIGSGKFTVSNSGIMNVTGATVSGSVTATSGKIGGWTIGTSTIQSSGTAYVMLGASGYIQCYNPSTGYSVKIENGKMSGFTATGAIRSETSITAKGDLLANGEFRAYDLAYFYKPPKIYNLTHVSSGGHLVFASDGATLAYLNNSSRRYKDVEREMSEADVEGLYKIPVVWAKYKEGRLDKGDERYGKYMPMFVAEDVNEHFQIAADHRNGLVEDWNYRIMIPAMFQMIKGQKRRTGEVSTKLSGETTLLKSQISSLQYQLQQAFARIAEQRKQIENLQSAE